ncbi:MULTISPECIES: hypothetical protein [Actinomadura]|uniref:Uncharacterized protein n=1 Tax=Actinomadura litoris TaxID=2678616 RepID=A0A7K1KV37_9ACTN|nr:MULTISPECIES: hypothetical protein [Actinomadura]MBT2211125.1 hypothetical protein [Actinomadura sp. NEAU-AAG7]MUN36044.1 hypothetical protein [Actinomadura litoris]
METARILIGLIVAVLLPDSLPVVRRSFLFRTVMAGLYGIWVMTPLLSIWVTTLLCLLAIFWSCSLRVWEKAVDGNQGGNGKPAGRSTDRLFGIRIYLTRILQRGRQEAAITLRWARLHSKSPHRRSVGSALTLSVTTAILLGAFSFDGPPRDVLAILTGNRAVVVVSGFLAATFVSHEVVARIYAQFDRKAPRLRTEIFSFSEAYGYIGWFERALVFAFVASGQAAAAALAIAAKSLARHPEIEKDREFGERFIIGTFVSVLFGVLWAVIVRLALGLKPM